MFCPPVTSNRFQSTLPARGATPVNPFAFSPAAEFQSTLPARGATLRHMQLAFTSNFNPRSPHGERRTSRPQSRTGLGISIHAPRTGSDCCFFGSHSASTYFNPRSPHGERHLANRAVHRHARRFQSTLPARGATPRHPDDIPGSGYFNPRSPHGERRDCE